MRSSAHYFLLSGHEVFVGVTDIKAIRGSRNFLEVSTNTASKNMPLRNGLTNKIVNRSSSYVFNDSNGLDLLLELLKPAFRLLAIAIILSEILNNELFVANLGHGKVGWHNNFDFFNVFRLQYYGLRSCWLYVGFFLNFSDGFPFFELRINVLLVLLIRAFLLVLVIAVLIEFVHLYDIHLG
jgi:hypothetical protein